MNKEQLLENDAFVDFLGEKHAENYMGTDDDMPEKFEAWMENLDEEDLKTYWDAYVLKTWQDHPDRTKPGITSDPINEEDNQEEDETRI